MRYTGLSTQLKSLGTQVSSFLSDVIRGTIKIDVA